MFLLFYYFQKRGIENSKKVKKWPSTCDYAAKRRPPFLKFSFGGFSRFLGDVDINVSFLRPFFRGDFSVIPLF